MARITEILITQHVGGGGLFSLKAEVLAGEDLAAAARSLRAKADGFREAFTSPPAEAEADDSPPAVDESQIRPTSPFPAASGRRYDPDAPGEPYDPDRY